jgi:hypothetical protein
VHAVQTHIVSFRYSGLIADHGVMDAADAQRVTLGARPLLSASGHYYTQGWLPRRLANCNKRFQILEFAPEHGSWQFDLLMNLYYGAIFEVLKTTFPELLVPAVLLGTAVLVASSPEWHAYDGTDQSVLANRIEPKLPILHERDETLSFLSKSIGLLGPIWRSR